jgi:quercetin dioxygenase-like cupin family protein
MSQPSRPPLPPDDPARRQVLAQADRDAALPHVALVGDTYTILLTGKDTGGGYCLIDMHIPPGGGPPPHRHDFEETFIVLDGEVEFTFRGSKSLVRAGTTVHIPANAPHAFRNASKNPARLLCICSPAGVEEFFLAVGDRVDSRTARPPEIDEAGKTAWIKKAMALAPQYRTEILGP